MAKGYQGNKERLAEFSSFGKAIDKLAGFKCEWCESKDAFEQSNFDDIIKERLLAQSQILK